MNYDQECEYKITITLIIDNYFKMNQILRVKSEFILDLELEARPKNSNISVCSTTSV